MADFDWLDATEPAGEFARWFPDRSAREIAAGVAKAAPAASLSDFRPAKRRDPEAVIAAVKRFFPDARVIGRDAARAAGAAGQGGPMSGRRLVSVMQDGADFYDAETGEHLATYPRGVRDFDLDGARAARAWFAMEWCSGAGVAPVFGADR